jgi:hypothetical protein
VQTRFRRLKSEARALSLPYSADEREALALLFLPFLLVASAVVVHQSVRTLHTYITAVSAPELEIAPARPDATAGLPLSGFPLSVARETSPNLTLLKLSAAAPEARLIQDPGASIAPAHPDASISAVGSPETANQPVTAAEAELNERPPSALDQAKPAETTLALLAPVLASEDARHIAQNAPPTPLASYEADDDGNPIFGGICSTDQSTTLAAAAPLAPASEQMTLTADAFGLRLATAAESQVGKLVIYNDAYRRISYPMGDVPSLFGVCTDVIVRAYRAIGLDLQTLVHEARAGRGDPSIDHRRTETLRRFFSAHGESLPVTSFFEDYRPGDIVTYHRPQNRGARAHIAMVSSVIAPSGRPMIVHNRGWGPQLEDALFVDQITGHYRYRGPSAVRNAGLKENQREPNLEAPRSPRPVGIAAPASPVVPASLRINSSDISAPGANRH